MKRRVRVEGDLAYIDCIDDSGQLIATAVIDAVDAPLVERFQWSARRRKDGAVVFEAFTSLYRLVCPVPAKMQVDHKDNDTLNNRRTNLRAVTHSQNQQNRRGAQRNSTTGVRGVSWNKTARKYQARVWVNGQQIQVGMFTDLDAAREATEASRARLMTHSKECA